MADQVLLSAGLDNFDACIELACERGLGIEVMAFAFPHVLDSDWEDTLVAYQPLLQPVPGLITLHGPFMDMVSGSPDEQINRICTARYQHAIRIASRLGAEIVVLHANFIGTLHEAAYRVGWHERNIAFWKPMAEYAEERGVTIALENMFEFDPDIIGNLLRDVDHPNLRACLDVGHSHLFSDDGIILDDWIETLQPWIVHTHMNNNDGKLDEHHGFDWEGGVLDYGDVLPKLRALPNPPSMVLEMYHVDDMRDSLHYFKIGESNKTLA